MPPKGGPIVTPFLCSLISSTSYPTTPTADELESIRGILYAKQQSVANELERAVKRQKKKKDVISAEEEAAALAANAQAGAKLEALERARNEAIMAKKGSSGGGKIKRERMSGEFLALNVSV